MDRLKQSDGMSAKRLAGILGASNQHPKPRDLSVQTQL